MRNWATRVCGIVLGTAAGSAGAAFTTPAAWNHGDAQTTQQQWDLFASPTGPNPANTPPTVATAPFNPNGAANVVESSGGSFVTSGGNIYSPTASLRVDLTVPEYGLGGGYVTTVLLQTRTQGSEAVYEGPGGIRLTYADGSGSHTVYPVSAAELSRTPLGGFGGAMVEYAAVFQVPFSPESLLLEVDAAGSSMSFDRAAVDTIVTRASGGSPLVGGMNPTVGFVPVAVPEPGVGLAIGGVVLAVLGARGRRRAP
jgi:hypothetical protein